MVYDAKMSWNPDYLIEAALRAGVDFEVESDWLKVDPYGKKFQPVGVVWHHTGCPTLAIGNMPSLNYCKNPGQYAGQARACHLLVGRNGKIQIIAGNGAYHAGAGGPLKVNGKMLPKDEGNKFLIGIEFEAHSSSKVNRVNLKNPKAGLNPAQITAVSKWNAELFDMLDWSTESAIRHKDWAPSRKADIGLDLERVHWNINRYRGA
jgi:N-acetylmuramoyl-L-alanine amidase CwlA